MSENTNSSNIDVSNTFGVSPPRNDSVLELLQFSTNLDIAKAQQRAAEAQQRAEKELEYGKLKETISTRVGHHRLSGDEFVQNVANVVMARNQEFINAALAPLIEVIRQSNVQMEAKIEQMGANFGQMEAKIEQMGANFGQMEAKIEQMGANFGQMEAKIEQMGANIEQMGANIEEMGNQLGNRISRLESGVEGFRNEVRQSSIDTSVRIAQNRNILNRTLLGRPADTVCFFSGEDPIDLGLTPIGTAADIDALSFEEIDRYCAGYGLPRPALADGQRSGCRTQKQSLRNFLYILNPSDLQQRMRNNRT